LYQNLFKFLIFRASLKQHLKHLEKCLELFEAANFQVPLLSCKIVLLQDTKVSNCFLSMQSLHANKIGINSRTFQPFEWFLVAAVAFEVSTTNPN